MGTKNLSLPQVTRKKMFIVVAEQKAISGSGRERERDSHIQIEIPHDFKLPGESPQRISMEREESILALPVTSQTTADDCK